ncbi:MAG TPA: hypothetical protein VND88_08195 [Candidatus Acidoferrales bacterium]|nr:hypothetical protein [Candidatus Acidoferrales bacterium]
MKLRDAISTSTVLIFLMLADSAWAWSTMPAGARMTVHWSVFGHPNRSAAKPVTLPAHRVDGVRRRLLRSGVA